MTRLLLAAALAVALSPASADEIEDAIAAGLAAYRAGDIAAAKDELDYATTLLGQKKAAGLTAFLPPAFDGWTRSEGDASAAGAALFGGGLNASASYARGGETIEIQIMADNPMVATMGAMLGNPAMMATQGEVRRVGRQRYVVSADGGMMALVGARALVQLSGSAAREDKIAYFESIDFAGLEAF
ncbi:MAG: hypothetical protein CVT86_03215 [Alphaproteobacteria bacterium HGW-Alphaproteobacteria-8]|nr:MAG: hypothetical protein CVT86_03215 [Alphaproteobacteria bacterium HGW-Alphaproteobacteria-8]